MAKSTFSGPGAEANGHAGEVPPLGDTLDFLRLMWAVDHALQKTSKRMESTIGITGPQRVVIRIVGRFPGISAKQLAAILHIHPSTLTGILRRLEKSGYLTRRIDPRDARRALLALSAKGRELDVYSEGTVESAVRSVIEKASADEVRSTAELLKKLAVALEATTAG